MSTNISFRLNEDNSRYIISVGGKEVILTAPENHGHSIKEVEDVTVINDVPCYVYRNEEGKYSLRPALDGSGMVIDVYCYDIDSWGTYGDFEKISCQCGYEWYMNVRQIPKNDQYEVMCCKCGMLLKRKKR